MFNELIKEKFDTLFKYYNSQSRLSRFIIILIIIIAFVLYIWAKGFIEENARLSAIHQNAATDNEQTLIKSSPPHKFPANTQVFQNSTTNAAPRTVTNVMEGNTVSAIDCGIATKINGNNNTVSINSEH